MMRGDKIFTEYYWKPFHKDFLHRMYSQTKSYVSIAIGLLEEEGKLSLDDKIMSFFEDRIEDELPDFMKERLVNWLKPLQDPNGYFYHPQWSRAASDAQLSRLGRDVNNAVAMLGWCGAKPTYMTPTGVAGDGLLADAVAE